MLATQFTLNSMISEAENYSFVPYSMCNFDRVEFAKKSWRMLLQKFAATITSLSDQISDVKFGEHC
jgi:hypothetical protein